MPARQLLSRAACCLASLLLVLALHAPTQVQAEERPLSNEEMKAAEADFARLFAAPGNGPDKKDLLERLVGDGSARALKMLGEALFKQVAVWWEMRKELDALAAEHGQILGRGTKGFTAEDERRVHEIQALMGDLEKALAREGENLQVAQDATARAPAALRLNLLRRARSSKDWTIRAAAGRVAALTRTDKDSWDFISKALVADPDARVRIAVLDALAASPPQGEEAIAADRAEDLVLGAVGDSEWGVQLRAVQILRELKSDRSVPHLINALGKCTPRVAESIAAALQALTDAIALAGQGRQHVARHVTEEVSHL